MMVTVSDDSMRNVTLSHKAVKFLDLIVKWVTK